MAKKTVTVVGATGVQGGSLITALLQDDKYSVRAVTRNPQSAAALALGKLGVSVVQADVDDYDSLVYAFAGSHVIFGVTNFYEKFGSITAEEAINIEVQQGINLAKAAAATESLEHYIWSTLPNTRKISNGKHAVPHFSGKNVIDDYIKSHSALFQKTTFFWVTFYATNILFPVFMPFPVSTAGPGKFIQLQSTPDSVVIKTIGDAKANVGVFAKSIIEKPELTLPGKYVLADVEDLTAGEFLSSWAKAQKKEAKYIQVPKSTFFETWPMWGEVMDKMMTFWEEAKAQSWTAEEGILTKEDLGVTGLVNTSEAFAQMNNWD
ncbi:NAD(P)-binding protein [Thozetella sp. PMI_491]|nr:NAD(P)-binding protein [Thozetella sp. PMI_491]